MNYMMNGMSSEESDEKKAILLYTVFLLGQSYQDRDPKFIHDTPYEFIKGKQRS